VFGLVLLIQTYIGIALSVAAFALELFAFVDAARARSAAFPVVGRLSKPVWLVILGVAMALAVLSFGNPVGLVSLIGAAAAIFYLVDTRPKVRQVGSGTSGRDGPYTGW